MAWKVPVSPMTADPDVKNYNYTPVDDKVYYRENSIMKPVDMSDSMQERIKGMVGIRNCTQELINLQLEEYPGAVIREKQAELNTLYDAFFKKYGFINSQTNKRAFNQDSNVTGQWNVKGKNADYGKSLVNMTYGTSRRNAYTILEDSLN